jgi:hypothetical protein
MILNWIIHNPSADGSAWIDITPDPINDADYKAPVVKAVAKGTATVVDLPGAMRMPLEIKLPVDAKLPAELYTRDQTKPIASDDGKLTDVVMQAVARYVAAFTAPVPIEPPPGVDNKLVDLVKQANGDTKKAIMALLVGEGLKPEGMVVK